MRTTNFGAFIVFIFLASFLTTTDAFAQSCNSDLKVAKNRDARSASVNDPTQFKLELTNNSPTTQTYQIEVVDYDRSFTVKGKTAQRLSGNSKLTAQVLYQNKQTNTIRVPGRSTVTFQTKVIVAPGTNTDRWGGLEVRALNSACPNTTVNALLKLYVSDASEQ